MATVNVGCKLPSGITIRLGEKHEKEGEGRDAVLNIVEAGAERRMRPTLRRKPRTARR